MRHDHHRRNRSMPETTKPPHGFRPVLGPLGVSVLLMGVSACYGDYQIELEWP